MLENYFNPDPKDLEERSKKRGFFINKYNADTSFLMPLESISPTKKPHKESNDKDKSLNSIKEVKDVRDSSFISPEHTTSMVNLNKSMTPHQVEGTHKKKKVTKVRYKHLKNEINDILEYFNELIKIETKYGEMLCDLGEPKFFNQSIIFIDDKNEKIYPTSEFPAAQKLLVIKFLNNRNAKKIVLPEWNIFRIGVRTIGKAHKDCAMFIKKGVNDMVYMFNNEYVLESHKILKERKDVKTSYYKTQTYLTKIGADFTEQQKKYEKLYQIYNESRIQKDDSVTQYKKEYDVKTASSNYGIF